MSEGNEQSLNNIALLEGLPADEMAALELRLER